MLYELCVFIARCQLIQLKFWQPVSIYKLLHNTTVNFFLTTSYTRFIIRIAKKTRLSFKITLATQILTF